MRGCVEAAGRTGGYPAVIGVSGAAGDATARYYRGVVGGVCVVLAMQMIVGGTAGAATARCYRGVVGGVFVVLSV